MVTLIWSSKIKTESILTGRFHTDIKTGIIKEPLFETPDITVESRETFFLVGRLDAFGSFDDCGDEKCFMNIDATTGLNRQLSWETTPFVISQEPLTAISHI